jgi:hypothetical protein
MLTIMAEYFYITFFSTDSNKGGFVSVQANTSNQVFKYAEHHYNGRVSIIYPASIFEGIKEHFPLGCLDEVSLISNQTDSAAIVELTKQPSYSYSPFVQKIISSKGIY